MPDTRFTDGHHEERHRDGSLRATGSVVDGQPDGFWEWFRLDGSKMRSGHFDQGTPVGEWITYTRDGKVHKVTDRT